MNARHRLNPRPPGQGARQETEQLPEFGPSRIAVLTVNVRADSGEAS